MIVAVITVRREVGDGLFALSEIRKPLPWARRLPDTHSTLHHVLSRATEGIEGQVSAIRLESEDPERGPDEFLAALNAEVRLPVSPETAYRLRQKIVRYEDVEGRLERALVQLEDLRNKAAALHNLDEHARLCGKREGVELALDYLRR